MEDRKTDTEELRLRELKRKIRDPAYLEKALQKIASDLTEGYYHRTQDPQLQR